MATASVAFRIQTMDNLSWHVLLGVKHHSSLLSSLLLLGFALRWDGRFTPYT